MLPLFFSLLLLLRKDSGWQFHSGWTVRCWSAVRGWRCVRLFCRKGSWRTGLGRAWPSGWTVRRWGRWLRQSGVWCQTLCPILHFRNAVSIWCLGNQGDIVRLPLSCSCVSSRARDAPCIRARRSRQKLARCSSRLFRRCRVSCIVLGWRCQAVHRCWLWICCWFFQRHPWDGVCFWTAP